MELLLLTADPHPGSVLPALSQLPHAVHVAGPQIPAVVGAGRRDAVLVDARTDLIDARNLCRLVAGIGLDVPIVAVLAECGLVAVSREWLVDAIVLTDTGAAEVDARLRLLRARSAPGASRGGVLVLGELAIDQAAYSVRLAGRVLELTYREFELLAYMAQYAGQVLTRAQLVQEVWGGDFTGDVRTVDVHVRRLRAKLGSEHEHMIGTVRNIGYKLVRPDTVRRHCRRSRDVDDKPDGQCNQA